MKKLWMMVGLFAAVMTFAGLDIWYTTRQYDRTHECLLRANESIEAHEEALNNPETVQLCEEANAVWEKGKRPLTALTNHNVIRYIDEKFVSLLEQVRGNNKDDATVTVKVLISCVKDLRKENYPLWENIL